MSYTTPRGAFEDSASAAGPDGTGAATVRPTQPAPVLAEWNRSQCLLACFCTGGEQDGNGGSRDTCLPCGGADTADALASRQACCTTCCARTLYMQLVFSGDLSAYTANLDTLESNVTAFVQLQSSLALNPISASEVDSVTFTAGSISSSLLLGQTVAGSTALQFAEYLTDQLNAQVTLRMENGLELIGLRVENEDPATTSTEAPATTSSEAPATTFGPDLSSSSDGNDDDSLSGGAIAGIVLGVLILLCCVGVAVFYFCVRGAGAGSRDRTSGRQIHNPMYEATTGMTNNPLATGKLPAASPTQEPRANNPYGQPVGGGGAKVDTSNPYKLAAVGVFALALIFAIAATADQTMVVHDGDLAGVDLDHYGAGVWTWSLEYSAQGTSVTADGDSCDMLFGNGGADYPDDYKLGCFDSMVSKCKAGKAFSLIGIFATMAAIPAAIVNFPQAKWVFIASGSVAIFSYMMVFAVWSAMYNGDKPEGSPPSHDSDALMDDTCGLGQKLAGGDAKLGAAFGLWVTGWLLCIVGLVLGWLGYRKAQPGSSTA